MSLLNKSRQRIADVLADHLTRHCASTDSRPAFFFLPGQDPMAYELPSQSLSALYWEGNAKQRERLMAALLDLAGRRAELFPLEALRELLVAIGSVGAASALLPFVRVLGARNDLGAQTFTLFGTALQVAKGMGPVQGAWDAVRAMVELGSFPEKLVYDAFDVGLIDSRTAWEHWFERLEPAMMRITNFSRRAAMTRRIKHSALEMARRLPASDIERGLKALLGSAVLEEQSRFQLMQSQVPRTLLAAFLVATPSAPLVVNRLSDGRLYLARAETEPGLAIPVPMPPVLAPLPKAFDLASNDTQEDVLDLCEA